VILPLFLVGLIVPVQMTLAPLTVLYSQVGLIDSLPGLFFLYLGFGLPFGVLVLAKTLRGLDHMRAATWMVPAGITSQVHAFDARDGGTFRISPTCDAPTGAGKTGWRSPGRLAAPIETGYTPQ
jgi:hypothetical protein